MRRAMMQRMQFSLLLLILGISASALANPNDYPEFAQKKVDDDISVTFVTAEEVKQRLDAGTPQTLVDVRKSSSFERQHLPKAVSIPLQSFPERYVEIPRDTPVVLYWTCPHHLASLAYQYLYRLGYRNIHVLKEGLPGWEKRQYPLQGTSQHATLR